MILKLFSSMLSSHFIVGRSRPLQANDEYHFDLVDICLGHFSYKVYFDENSFPYIRFSSSILKFKLLLAWTTILLPALCVCVWDVGRDGVIRRFI